MWDKILTLESLSGIFQAYHGAVAQPGERMTGSHEVRGSIPLSSTSQINKSGGNS